MQSQKPTVSIGLTVYNGEEFLPETLDAFLAQTYPDFELIISDNASTDRTVEISRDYAAKDPRLRYSRNETNLGLAGNHNRAFALARGKFFKWAASDDVCLPDYLTRCVEVLENDPSVVLAYPKTWFINAQGAQLDIEDPGWNLRSDSAYERMRYVVYKRHWANAVVGLIRSSALGRTRLMPSYPGGDFRVLGELSLLGKLYEVPEHLFLRRLHPRSSSQNTHNQAWEVEYWKGSSDVFCAPFLSLCMDHFLSIARSQLRMSEKLLLAGSLLRNMRWGQEELLEELDTALSSKTRRGLFRAPEPVSRANGNSRR